jgi:hypothetical protein
MERLPRTPPRGRADPRSFEYATGNPKSLTYRESLQKRLD